MARHFVEVVFDDFIMGTTAVFTPDQLSALMGTTARLALQVVTDKVTGSSVTLTVMGEESLDGRSWSAVTAAGPEISGALSATATTVMNGALAGTNPRARLVRLRLTLGGTTPGAHVVVYATGRDRA